jgi:hypothetical protein
MKHQPVIALVRIDILILLALTSCAQLPPSSVVVKNMHSPAYPDTQFLDPEKFDVGTLTNSLERSPVNDPE